MPLCVRRFRSFVAILACVCLVRCTAHRSHKTHTRMYVGSEDMWENQHHKFTYTQHQQQPSSQQSNEFFDLAGNVASGTNIIIIIIYMVYVPCLRFRINDRRFKFTIAMRDISTNRERARCASDDGHVVCVCVCVHCVYLGLGHSTKANIYMLNTMKIHDTANATILKIARKSCECALPFRVSHCVCSPILNPASVESMRVRIRISLVSVTQQMCTAVDDSGCWLPTADCHRRRCLYSIPFDECYSVPLCVEAIKRVYIVQQWRRPHVCHLPK